MIAVGSKLKMGLFGLWNYEDYLLKLLVTSKFARNGLIILLTYLMAAVVRFHLSIILCILFTFNNMFDLISPIIISVLVAMTSDALYGYAETHRPRYEIWVDYVIANYSVDNFIRWKRTFLTGVLIYVLIGLYFIQIDNYYIFLSIAQTTVSFIICDFLEQKLPQAWYSYLLNWLQRPQITKFPIQRTVIRNYISQQKMVQTPQKVKRRHSAGSLSQHTPNKPVKIHSTVQVDRQLIKPEPVRVELPQLIRVESLPPKPPTPPLQGEIKSHYD